jgi:tRNA pseudouridine38-40 synthase
MRYCIEIAYLGTDFAGWQNQNNAVSVQELIEKGLTTLLRQEIQITGSSRTDAGVHASQQFAHFDCDKKINLPDLSYRLNQILPFSISIINIKDVVDSFHARFDAKARAYEYRITKVKDPFLQNRSYQFSTNLDIEMMNKACDLLLQYTDFECFSKLHTDVKTFNCDIYYANWVEYNQLLIFRIKANRFLRGMVRAIVGTLLEVGLGKMNLAQFESIILSKNRSNAGVSVPAKGLFLVEVEYEWQKHQ